MKYILNIVSFLLLFYSSFSNSQTYESGNDLLAACKQAETVMNGGQARDLTDVTWCAGLVQGTKNILQVLSPSLSDQQIGTCLPSTGINNGQAIRIVNNYLERNTSMLHYQPSLLVHLALREAYPCK